MTIYTCKIEKGKTVKKEEESTMYYSHRNILMETTKPAGKKSKKGAGNLKGFIRESKGL